MERGEHLKCFLSIVMLDYQRVGNLRLQGISISMGFMDETCEVCNAMSD